MCALHVPVEYCSRVRERGPILGGRETVFNKHWSSTNVSVWPLTCELLDLRRWVSLAEVHPASSRHLFVHTMN